MHAPQPNIFSVCQRRAPYNDSNPYRLTRNLLIRSPIEPVGQLDFQFLSSKVLIASGVTVTLEKLVLRNVRWAEARELQATPAAATGTPATPACLAVATVVQCCTCMKQYQSGVTERF